MRSLREFWNEESGVGVVELILIVVVLIGVVIMFRNSLRDLVKTIFKTINDDAGTVHVDEK